MPDSCKLGFDLAVEQVWLPPSTGLSFPLAFHELTTNALKYGALSNATGSVSISWRLERADEDGGILELLEWREVGGPPVAPRKPGFGAQLLQRAFAGEKAGRVELVYERVHSASGTRTESDPGRLIFA
jgi:two-component sensor histidine kinase